MTPYMQGFIKAATVDGKSYGWLGLAITGDIKSKLLAAHKLIDKRDLNSDGCDKDPHVTLAYGLDAKQNPKQVERVLADSKAVKIKLGPLSAFKHDDQTVLKFDIISPQLKALNAKVKSGIKLPGNSYSVFKPHITVAYCKPGTQVSKYKKLETGLRGKTQKLDVVEYQDAGDKSREYMLKAAVTMDQLAKAFAAKVQPRLIRGLHSAGHGGAATDARGRIFQKGDTFDHLLDAANIKVRKGGSKVHPEIRRAQNYITGLHEADESAAATANIPWYELSRPVYSQGKMVHNNLKILLNEHNRLATLQVPQADQLRKVYGRVSDRVRATEMVSKILPDFKFGKSGRLTRRQIDQLVNAYDESRIGEGVEIKAGAVTLDIEKGDTLLGGRFKNMKTVVKDIGTDELGQPTINGKKLLSFRIAKLMPKSAGYQQGFMTKAAEIFTI